MPTERSAFAEEMAVLSSLPARRLEMARRLKARVDSGSTIHVGGNTYSLPSRLIGEQVDVHVGAETLEVWHGASKVDTLPRLRGRGKHRIEYRHVIDWLVRKPGAFEEYRYRDAMFPTSRFRMAYDVLEGPAARPRGQGVPGDPPPGGPGGREPGWTRRCGSCSTPGRRPTARPWPRRFRQGRRPPAVTDVLIVDVDLTMYDRLLEPREAP